MRHADALSGLKRAFAHSIHSLSCPRSPAQPAAPFSLTPRAQGGGAPSRPAHRGVEKSSGKVFVCEHCGCARVSVRLLSCRVVCTCRLYAVVYSPNYLTLNSMTNSPPPQHTFRARHFRSLFTRTPLEASATTISFSPRVSTSSSRLHDTLVVALRNTNIQNVVCCLLLYRQ